MRSGFFISITIVIELNIQCFLHLVRNKFYIFFSFLSFPPFFSQINLLREEMKAKELVYILSFEKNVTYTEAEEHENREGLESSQSRQQMKERCEKIYKYYSSCGFLCVWRSMNVFVYKKSSKYRQNIDFNFLILFFFFPLLKKISFLTSSMHIL